MEKLELKYKKVREALDSLNEIIKYTTHIEELTKINQDLIPDFNKILRDSMIQRFEYSFDIFWKYLKMYLKDIIKITPEINSPKSTFKECLKTGLISESDTHLAIEMLDSRSLICHTYQEKQAEQISTKIPTYYKLMNKILNKTKK